jgi:hypothetical protein
MVQKREMVRQGAARIVLERPGRHGGRRWQYQLTWYDGASGVVLLRAWGVTGSERKRRRFHEYRTRTACQAAIDRTVVRLQRVGYRVE